MTARGSCNIAAGLSLMAAERPEAFAVIAPMGRGRYAQWTYRMLDHKSDQVASGLIRLGVGRGVRTVLMVPPVARIFRPHLRPVQGRSGADPG